MNIIYTHDKREKHERQAEIMYVPSQDADDGSDFALI